MTKPTLVGDDASLSRTPWLLSLPVAMGYIPLGMVFGFLFVQAGGPWWLAIASSVVVYAGAAQFMMVPMLAAGLPPGHHCARHSCHQLAPRVLWPVVAGPAAQALVGQGLCGVWTH